MQHLGIFCLDVVAMEMHMHHQTRPVLPIRPVEFYIGGVPQAIGTIATGADEDSLVQQITEEAKAK